MQSNGFVMIKYNNGRYTSALFKEPEYFIYLHQAIFVDKAYLKKQKRLLHFFNRTLV